MIAGSAHPKPNHRFEVHDVFELVADRIGADEESPGVGRAVVVASLQCPNQPGVLHVELDGLIVVVV